MRSVRGVSGSRIVSPRGYGGSCDASVMVLKPATGRPCILALVDSGTVPAFTFDCLRVASVFMWRRYFDLCLREQCLRSKIMSVARVAHVLLLRPIFCIMDVNTLASKRSELIGNAEIVRMHRVIHNNSTCVCMRLPVAAITQKRKNASFDLWPALGDLCVR